MPFSPTFALPYENPQPSSDQPGITLHGGVPPTALPADQQILALRVDDVLAGMTADDVSLDARVTALEAAVAAIHWRHINEGTQVGGTDFAIVVPAGYSRLRLTMVGDLAGQDAVNLRINGDTSTIYSRGLLGWDAAGAQDFAEYNAGTSSWKVAEWSTVESNTTIVDIQPTDGTQNPSIQARSTQVATGATTHRQYFAWGKYAGDVVVSTLNLFPGTSTWATCRWWLEGYLL